MPKTLELRKAVTTQNLPTTRLLATNADMIGDSKQSTSDASHDLLESTSH